MTIAFEVSEYKCLIDDTDFEILDLHWTPLVKKTSRTVYVRYTETSHDKPAHTYIHRLIMERMLGRSLSPNEHVDHIDGNGLNNTRENLRFATASQNQANRGAAKNNKSGFKGVLKRGDRFAARLGYKGKSMYLGTYDTPEAAHAAYMEAAKEYFGEFARGE